MSIKLVILGAMSLLVLVLACQITSNEKVDDATLIERENWSIVKSPLTGKCYETFDTFRLMGMAEVDCDIPTSRQLK